VTEQGQEGTAPESDAGPSPAIVEPAAPGTGDNDRTAPAARVVLVGLPGSGKSTIGRKLARELGVELYDTDAGIEADTGRTIPDIFATDGEKEFRRIEEEVVRRAVLSHDGVVSLGGGSVLSERTRDLLRGAVVVYLEISVSEGVRRTGASSTRPLLNGVDPAAKYRDLMRERRPLYREIASVRVRTDGRSPGRVVRMILAKLGLESVRTDLQAPRTSAGNASPASGSVTGRPGTGSNRSKNRRRARARAAAARRSGADQTGVVATERRDGPEDRNRSGATQPATDRVAVDDTTGAARTAGAAQGESRATAGRRSRRSRSRRGGARIRSATSVATRETGGSVGENPDSRAGSRSEGRAGTADNQPGNRTTDAGQAGNRATGAGGRAGNRGTAGSRVGGRSPVAAGQTAGRNVGRGRRTASREAGAPGRAGQRGGEPAGPSSSATPDPSAQSRTGAPQPVQRAGPPGDSDRGTGTNERRRRGQPRRRGGRRNNNDQKESEQRT
jgi:shikimate kinase / 3-dehydroquinate synthase